MKSRLINYIVALSILSLGACTSKSSFKISGVITAAEGAMLYLERNTIDKVVTIDSMKLDREGDFSFKAKASQGAPEFYRLRLGKQTIDWAIDSCEHIKVNADSATFATNYKILDSYVGSLMKQIRTAQASCSHDIENAIKSYPRGSTDLVNAIQSAQQAFKETVTPIIISNPKSAAAYFGLFQQLPKYNLYIYDFYDQSDSKILRAVATSWHQYYPNDARSQHLYKLAMQSIAQIRRDQSLTISTSDLQETGILDVALPNKKGEITKLSSLKGQVVILDFTSYSIAEMGARNLILRKWYDLYRSKGLSIYQVCLDTDEHLWKNAAAALPWICVQDQRAEASPILMSYNIKGVPTSFIINKEGDLVERCENIQDLERKIIKYMR